MVHRVRDGFVKARTAVANQICGLLSEFGLVLPQGIQILRHRLYELLDDATHELPELFRTLIRSLYEHFKTLDQQVHEHEVVLLNGHKNHADSQLLETMLATRADYSHGPSGQHRGYSCLRKQCLANRGRPYRV